jgi:predicted RNA-binding protein with TRAM domain
MVEIPESLESLYTGQIQERDGEYLVEIPASEVNRGTVEVDETYRIAILRSTTSKQSSATEESTQSESENSTTPQGAGPPVDEGEVREVTVESVGDQGDGIAKVERGFVVIVPDTLPGDKPTVEIEQVRDNVAFASIVENNTKLPS